MSWCFAWHFRSHSLTWDRHIFNLVPTRRILPTPKPPFDLSSSGTRCHTHGTNNAIHPRSSMFDLAVWVSETQLCTTLSERLDKLPSTYLPSSLGDPDH